MTGSFDQKGSSPKAEMGILPTLRLSYSLPRLQWLVLTMASMSVLYLSSQEIWSTVDGKPYPEITSATIAIYCVFFLAIDFAVHSNDIAGVTSKSYVQVTVAILSILVDLGALSLAEFMTILSIQVCPREPLSLAELLLLGAMPGSLGVVTLSSLTTSTLRERASRLKREVHELAKKAEELDKKWQLAEASLATFERKKRAFMQSISQDGDKESA